MWHQKSPLFYVQKCFHGKKETLIDKLLFFQTTTDWTRTHTIINILGLIIWHDDITKMTFQMTKNVSKMLFTNKSLTKIVIFRVFFNCQFFILFILHISLLIPKDKISASQKHKPPHKISFQSLVIMYQNFVILDDFTR